MTTDVMMSGSSWPDIQPFSSNLVLAKIVPGTEYLSWIVTSPFWQLVHPQNHLP